MLEAAPVVVTLWPSRRHPFGRRQTITWATFVRRFVAAPEPSTRKEDVAGFSLATFTGDRRALDRVEFAYALTLDFDDGATTLDEAARLFPRVCGVAYTTYSSTPKTPKLRLVLLCSRPITPEEYSRLWAWANRRCVKKRHPIDVSACDASRFWFLPSHPFGCTTYAWRELRGRVLDVDKVLRIAAARHIDVLPGQRAGGTRPGPRKDVDVPASETLLGRAFTHAEKVLDTRDDGTMLVTCPWEGRHTSGDCASSTVVFPSTSATARGHFHCKHAHCVGRTARDVLLALPRRAVARARRDHGLEQRVRATVVRAWLDSRPGWDSRPPLVRWRLDLATRGGELLSANVVLPTAGMEHASATFDAVFPNLRWRPQLAHLDEWRRRKLVPVGMKLDVTVRGSEITSMQVAKIGPRKPVSKARSSPSREMARARRGA
jgi:hypothetical protein